MRKPKSEFDSDPEFDSEMVQNKLPGMPGPPKQAIEQRRKLKVAFAVFHEAVEEISEK